VALCKAMDDMLSSFMKSEYSKTLNEVGLVVVEKVLGWIDKLDYLKNKYKVYNIDQMLQKISSVSEPEKLNDEIVSKLLDVLRR